MRLTCFSGLITPVCAGPQPRQDLSHFLDLAGVFPPRGLSSLWLLPGTPFLPPCSRPPSLDNTFPSSFYLSLISVCSCFWCLFPCVLFVFPSKAFFTIRCPSCFICFLSHGQSVPHNLSAHSDRAGGLACLICFCALAHSGGSVNIHGLKKCLSHSNRCFSRAGTVSGMFTAESLEPALGPGRWQGMYEMG